MRRKHNDQLLAKQLLLNHSKQIASARVKQAARDGEMTALHESIARIWKLEHQAQSVGAELYAQRQKRLPAGPSEPVVLDETRVTLRHADSVRIVRFSSLLATDVSIGLIGLDNKIGQALHGAQIMSVITVPTALGEKSYQIVAINKIELKSPQNRMPDATDRSSDNDTSEASAPADMPQHSRPRRRLSEH